MINDIRICNVKIDFVFNYTNMNSQICGLQFFDFFDIL